MSSDRLTGLDASFLHLEDASSHMHVAGVMIFEGDPPPYDDLLEAIDRRLGLVPRYRQRLAFVPLEPGPARSGSTTRTSTCATTCAPPRCPPPAPRSS